MIKLIISNENLFYCLSIKHCPNFTLECFLQCNLSQNASAATALTNVGLKGGATCLCSRAFQSVALKKLCCLMFPFTPRRSSGSLTNNCSTNTPQQPVTVISTVWTNEYNAITILTDWLWSECPWSPWWASGDKWGCLFVWTETAPPHRGRGTETDRWASRRAEPRMTTSLPSRCTSGPARSESDRNQDFATWCL